MHENERCVRFFAHLVRFFAQVFVLEQFALRRMCSFWSRKSLLLCLSYVFVLVAQVVVVVRFGVAFSFRVVLLVGVAFAFNVVLFVLGRFLFQGCCVRFGAAGRFAFCFSSLKGTRP